MTYGNVLCTLMHVKFQPPWIFGNGSEEIFNETVIKYSSDRDERFARSVGR